MLARRQITTIPEGNPVPQDTQVEMRLHADNSLVATTGTDAEGWFEFLLIGNPGPHYFIADYEDEVHISSSRATGVAGVVDLANLPLLIRSFQSGYVDGVLGNLLVQGFGNALQVTVQAGAGYYRGILYDQYESVNFPIAAPAAQARIDTVVVQVVPEGGGDTIEGRSRIVIKQGTPSTSPVAPGLTQTDTLWEEPLADVRVDPGVSAIASNKVTSRRTRLSPVIPAGSITYAMLENIAKPGVRVNIDSTNIIDHARALVFGGNDFIATSNYDDDYTNADRPFAYLTLNRTSILAWLETALGLDVVTAPENPTYTVRNSPDANFDASGVWSGGFAAIPGATATFTVPAGSWLIETQLHMTIRGSGSGAQCTIRLTGNGTPQGAEMSQRIYAVTSGTYRTVILTGRRTITNVGNTVYTATVERSHQSGAYVDFRDGVIYMKAYKV